MKIFLKGILLWVTFIVTMLFVSSIDSISEKGPHITMILISVCIVLWTLCRMVLSIKDLYILSGYKILNNLIK